MSKKISQKIVGYKVATEEQTKEVVAKEPESNIIQMHEKVSRPEELAGSTYKIDQVTIAVRGPPAAHGQDLYGQPVQYCACPFEQIAHECQ